MSTRVEAIPRPGGLAPGVAARRRAESVAAARSLVPMDPGHRVWLLSVYAGYLFLAGLLALVTDAPGAQWSIPALALFLALRAYPLLRPAEELAWFHPLVFGTAYSLVGLMRGFGAYAFGLERHLALPAWGPEELGRLVAFESLLTALGLVSYYLGFFTLPAPRAPRLRFRTPSHLPLKVVLCVLVSAVAFLLYMRSQGGITAHILSWGRSRHVALAGEHHWLALTRIGVFGCVVWLASDRQVVRNPVFWGCVSSSLGLVFLATGGRAAVVFPIAFGLVVWMLTHGRLSLTRMAVLGFAGLFLISVLGQFRAGTYRNRMDWHVLTEASPVEAVQRVVTGELVDRATTSDGVLPILAYVPHRVDHLYGSSYLAFLTLPVPRKLWEGKPGMIGGRVGMTFFGRQGGVPPGPIGEAYWNFNVPGVVVIFLLYGVFHRWLLRFYLAHERQAGAAILYGLTIFLASPATPALVGLATAVVSTLCLMMAFGMLTPWRRGGGPAEAHAS